MRVINVEKKKSYRSGYTKKQFTFLNVHGRKNFKSVVDKCKYNLEELEKNSVLFFSETWITDKKKCIYTPFNANKDTFASNAVPAKNELGIAIGGRPSGGLEFVVGRGLGAKEITKSDNHLIISFSDTYVIGVYYQPSLDFEDLITDLIKALEEVPKEY